MKKLLLICILLFSISYGYCGQRGMYPKCQIDFVKAQINKEREPYYSAYLQLMHYADSIQNMTHNALCNFAVPGYYDKPLEHRANSLALQHDAFGAYCSALAYQLSGNKKYGEKACYFLDAWSFINKSYSEHDGVLVMTYSGSALMIAAELMSDEDVWKNKNKFKTWVTQVYQRASNTIRTDKNNWGDWGRFGSLLAASFLNDKTEIAENVRLIKSDIFDKIAVDGSMPEETKRGSNGIWYTYFSLAPMTAASWIVYNLTHENLFTLEKEGRSIKKALDYLFYYNLHPTEWKWNEKPNIGTPELWPGNLFEAMAGIYNETEYANYVNNHRPIIYPTHHFAWSFPTLMPIKFGTYK
ncbi:MAG: alginate lyase family protein [Paludibacter sp.]